MAQQINNPPNVDKEILSWEGNTVAVAFTAGIIVRAVLNVLPLVYILGADNWTVLAFVITYSILFGILVVIVLAILIRAAMRSRGNQSIFGSNIVTWNPLRHFYAAAFYTIVDYATNMSLWYVWLYRNDEYLNSPTSSNTPDPNAAGFYPFQMLCGAFIFSSVIMFVLYFNVVRSLWTQRQALTNRANDVDEGIKTAYGQLSERNTFAHLDHFQKPSGMENNNAKIRAFIATGAIYHLVMVVYLFIYAYHVFYASTEMNYTAVTVLLWLGVGFYIINISIYYIPSGSSPSVQHRIRNSQTDNDKITAETNAEMDAEVGNYFLTNFFILAFNIIFAIYAYLLSGTNDIEWGTVPKFDPFAVVQSAWLYVWLTNAALNYGALPFFVYYAVTFVFVSSAPENYDNPPDAEESGSIQQNDSSANQPLLANQQGATKTLVGYRKGSVFIIIMNGVALLVWAGLYFFFVQAMVGGHVLAQYMFPVTLTFCIVFGILIIAFYAIMFTRTSRVQTEAAATNTEQKSWEWNKTWYLSLYRNVVSITITFLLQAIVLIVTLDKYFNNRTNSDWECIKGIPSTATPPYSSCSLYWTAAILALYCCSLVYLICIINEFATQTVKVQIIKTIMNPDKKT